MKPKQQIFHEFLVVDTEGKDLLKEIAVLDRWGVLLYHAWVAEHPDNSGYALYTYPLQQVLSDFLKLAKSLPIVCHHAKHDRQVIQRACQIAQIPYPSLHFVCTVELAQATFPDLASYSLASLSRRLQLKVNHQLFNPRQAHTAKYDAEFTYQLYRTILAMQSSPVISALQSQPNPFSSSRVDTPFQTHPDQKQVYQQEFEQLKLAIGEIHQDANHQTRGAVVIGEPGSGKTHLMMRLAKELLRVNRLLFIRHPNNPDAILYHTYSRILESFIETVPDTGYTQLEHLIGHSFTKLISTSRYLKLTQADQKILEAVKESPLKLYKLAGEGTESKRKLWQHIEKRTHDWWVQNYGFAGYAPQILKGIIRFCSYSDPRRRNIVTRWLTANSLSAEDLELVGLEDWQESLSQEEFSLEAIGVFSKLSLLDEPLLIVFDQLESLGLPHNEKLLLNFGEAVKEIFTHVPNSLIILTLFPDRWEQFQQVWSSAVVDRLAQTQIELQRPSLETLERILQVRAQEIDLKVAELFLPEDLEVVLKQPSIRGMLNCAAHYFRYRVHGTPLPSKLSAPMPTITDPVKTSSGTPIVATVEHSPELAARLDRLETGLADLQRKFQQLLNANVSLVQSAEGLLEQISEGLITPPASEDLASPQSYSPIREYLRTQRLELQRDYQKPQIITDSDDLGKLTTIAEAFREVKPFEIEYLQLGKRTLPEHLVLLGNRKVAVGFLQIDGGAFTSRIKNWNEALMNDRTIQYQLWRDVRQSEITGKVGREEIEKLNHSRCGKFLQMDEEQRLDFEVIYRLVIDIQNRDLEIDLKEAIEDVLIDLKDSWICQLFQTI